MNDATATATADLTDDIPFEELVKELDAMLDAWFMQYMTPALDAAEASRSDGEREAAA
jgi:hypothetical protein